MKFCFGNEKKNLIRHVYSPPKSRKRWKLDEFLNVDIIRYFAFGRHALATGLQFVGVEKGDQVLLPEFICRDLLSSINAIGAEPVFYPIDDKLNPGRLKKTLPKVKAIIAVNYFGFPQNLDPFREYCERTGAALVEDNAHGLFSCDENGVYLGTRGDIGIFSLRKTTPMPDGAALVVNRSRHCFQKLDHGQFQSRKIPRSFRSKQLLRRITPWAGIWLLKSATLAARRVRELRTGFSVLPSPQAAEWLLPEPKFTSEKSLFFLQSLNVEKEKQRRRELFQLVEQILSKTPCKPVFQSLPQYTVPYMYPFYAQPEDMKSIKHALFQKGLECFPWPELPDSVKSTAPAHYRNIWGVNFLW